MSIAFAPEEGEPLYLALTLNEINDMALDPWVAKFVVPNIDASGAMAERLPRTQWSARLTDYFQGAESVSFIADWPDDIRYLMQAITVTPGKVIPLPDFSANCVHVASWPTKLKGAVRHNALWDAMALREAVLEDESRKSA